MGENQRPKRELGHQPRVRYINGLTIYFATKQAIYVTDGKVSIVLERWFDSNNYQKAWRLLMWRLTRNKDLETVYDAWELASRYGICRHQSFHFPEIKQNTKVIKEEK